MGHQPRVRQGVLLGLLFLALIPPQHGCRAEAHEGKLRLAITGDKYPTTGEAHFYADAAKIQQAILHTSPFDEYADIIDFKVVWNASSLGCTHSTTMSRLITCNMAQTTAALNTAAVDYDHIIVVVNDGSYGGSGGSLTVTYNGAQMVEVVKHEFGHTFGGLLDEYLLYGSNGTVQNRLQANIYLAPTVPATVPGKWTVKGYRPNYSKQRVVKADGTFTSSLMEALGKPFNEISKSRLRERLEQYRQS